MAQYAQAEGATGDLSLTRDRLLSALRLARRELLSRRLPAGYWEGRLSSSALSTATAVTALALGAAPEDAPLVAAGVRWLGEYQNADGGWGDTTDSPSNIATTLLCFSALTVTYQVSGAVEALTRAAPYVSFHTGSTPAERVAAITAAYGEDRTFAVPILMNCAIAGLVEWQDIPPLPYELATLPQSWYRLTKMQVVSYALPALIAVGLAIEHHRPLLHRRSSLLRRLVSKAVQRKLVSLQPITGGFLEAAPLTAFVCMALLSLRKSHRANPRHDPTATVLNKGLDFLRRSMRPDGSWPIDTNLSVWVTSSALNALNLSGGLPQADAEATREWLTERQYQHRHQYTGAAPGGFGWTHLAGGVPDADDTSGALLALADHGTDQGITDAAIWLCDLQNTDGGWPTFCRGWGKLPFDKSCDDITAHALRALKRAEASSDCRARARTAPAVRLQDRDEPTAIANPARYETAPYRRGKHPARPRPFPAKEVARAITRGLDHLSTRQRPDGSWVPLWFGNQAAPEHLNPVLGTARVLLAWAEFDRNAEESLQGLQFLISAQNVDGGWGGAPGVPSTVEETALAISALSCWPQECRIALERGLSYLLQRIENDDWTEPAPVGLYFASLWYSEELYPIVWTVEALGRALSAFSLT